MTEKIKIITPETAENPIDQDLVGLTEFLVDNGCDDGSGGIKGFLGGRCGYGVDFENEVFMMHSYCWCEKDDCEWCVGCECPESAFHYFIDDKEVPYNEYIKFYDDKVDVDSSDWKEQVKEANSHRSERQDKICRLCRGEFGNAPNFYYKPTSFKVWWYKWIGRSSRYDREVSPSEWDKIMEHCRKSVRDRDEETNKKS
ncbi:hypothetical protein IID24_03030 [Patescibacteria group bacterium]|nr:hypothetical protein [Patescibacteria group bacterium]